MIKQRLQAIAIVVVAALFTLVMAEGLYALWRGNKPQPSITSKTVDLVKEALGRGRTRDVGFYAPVITKAEEFEALLDDFKADGVALGNSTYDVLRTERARINTTVDGCKAQKPNLDKEMTYLRAGLFEPFSLVTAFYDRDAKLSPDVQAFIDRYATRRIRQRTNQWGERLTLPLVESKDRVIVAGDSIANGAMLNDEETLASRLQARDPSRQYVNIGIGGADAHEIACALERAAKRYPGEIRELIYIYCENDFKNNKPMGTPEEVVAFLKDYTRQQGIEKTTVIYAPYIYNVVPHLTRFRTYRGGRFRSHKEQRESLERLAQGAGFDFVDMADLAFQEIDDKGTQFAGLVLFIDHAHWSPVGTSKMADLLISRRGP